MTLTEALGEVTLIYVDLGQKGEPLVAKVPGSVDLQRGATIHLSAPTRSALRFFDEAGRAIRRENRIAAA